MTEEREDALAKALCLLDSFAGEGLGHVYGNGQTIDAEDVCTELAASVGLECDPGWWRTAAALVTRPSTPPAVSDDLVEEMARALAKADGLDWDETCALECPHQPDVDECDSSTCVAAMVEDHDPDMARTIYLRHVRAILPIIQRREQQAAEAHKGWLLNIKRFVEDKGPRDEALRRLDLAIRALRSSKGE